MEYEIIFIFESEYVLLLIFVVYMGIGIKNLGWKKIIEILY